MEFYPARLFQSRGILKEKTPIVYIQTSLLANLFGGQDALLKQLSVILYNNWTVEIFSNHVNLIVSGYLKPLIN